MTIFKGVPWSGGLKIGWGSFQLRGTKFWRRCEIELRSQLITNRISQWSWVTLNMRAQRSSIVSCPDFLLFLLATGRTPVWRSQTLRFRGTLVEKHSSTRMKTLHSCAHYGSVHMMPTVIALNSAYRTGATFEEDICSLISDLHYSFTMC